MPNPFPGMNPYLETPGQWSNVHSRLIALITDVLDASMPPGYTASIGERCRVVQTGRGIYPDVYLSQNTPFATPERGGAAVAERVMAGADLPTDPALIVERLPVMPRQTYIEIRDARQGERVVTTIEVLSPVNKTRGEGQTLYLAKQQEILGSRTHLVEIDLLRAGQPTVAARPLTSAEAGSEMERRDYITCLHRGGHGERYAVWPVSLRQRLPRIAIPLSDGDADIPLDLQAVLDQCYERGRFGQKTDYAQPPDPPLTGEDAAWADTLLRERGLRS